MNGWEFAEKYLWYIILLIVTAFIFNRISQKRKIKDFSIKELAFIGELLLLACVFILFYHYIFNGDKFFIFGFTIFFIFGYMLISYILRDRIKVLINSSILGEEFIQPLSLETIVSLSSGIEVYLIPEEVYKEYIHVGDKNSRWFDLSDTIKHSDYFDQDNGILFHPEIAEMHNLSLIDCQPFYLVMKEDLPKLRRENIALTHFLDYQIAFKQEAIQEDFVLKLKSMYNQHKDAPFPIRDSLKDIQKSILAKAKQLDPEIKTEDKISEVKENDIGSDIKE